MDLRFLLGIKTMNLGVILPLLGSLWEGKKGASEILKFKWGIYFYLR